MKDNRKELILITGGARSGKSSWAVRYIEHNFKSYMLIATAIAEDKEMEERIQRHKMERGHRWKVVEEPFEITECIEENSHGFDVILVDCLSIWLSNILLKRPQMVERYMDNLIDMLSYKNINLILVSNEVGMGVVPAYKLGREYRDLLGGLNQRIARIADRVILMISGLPLMLKGGRVDAL